MEVPKVVESFVTSRGNSYTVLSPSKKQKGTSTVIDQPVIENVFFTEAVIEEESPININLMLVPEKLITELKNK